MSPAEQVARLREQIERANNANYVLNVPAAIQVAERLGPGSKVVTLMADSGLKYLSTDVYGGKAVRRTKQRLSAH